jgi:hypothetical protein
MPLFRARRADEGWIEWATELVDYHLERIKRMAEHQNPNVQTPTEFQYYVTRNGIHSDYDHRTHEELVGDVKKLHLFTRQLVVEKNQLQDTTKKLLKEKDQMMATLSKAKRKADTANLKAWVLMLIVAGEGTVIGWLVHEFLSRLK